MAISEEALSNGPEAGRPVSEPVSVPVPGDAAGATVSGDREADGGIPRLLDIEEVAPGSYGDLEPLTAPLIDRLGRVRLSFSRIDTYQNCPRKFRYGYIDRLPGKPSPHLSFGSSLHAALEAFYDRKLPECPTEDELLGFLYDHWDSRGFAHLDRSEQLAFYRHGQDVLRRFHQRNAPTFRLPAATEAWFEMPIGHEAVVVGSMDRVDVDDDGEFHVIDYKTNRKVRDRRYVAGSLQLSLYALACRHLYGSLPRTVSLEFVVPGVTITVERDDLDLDAAREAVLSTAAAVRAEEFAPTPNRLCDWCDFRAVCPAWNGDGEELLGPAVEELTTMRRRLAREVRELRELEAGVQRLADELA